MTWTHFWDMHSGGGQKEKWHHIFIEAPQKQAEIIFYNRFGHNPYRVTCTCCGEDYAIDEQESLEQITGFHRNCAYDNEVDSYIESPAYSDRPERYQTLSTYLRDEKEALLICAEDIKPEELIGSLPQQGYVWVD